MMGSLRISALARLQFCVHRVPHFYALRPEEVHRHPPTGARLAECSSSSDLMPVAILAGNTPAALVADVACVLQGLSPVFLPSCGTNALFTLLAELRPALVLVDHGHFSELSAALALEAALHAQDERKWTSNGTYAGIVMLDFGMEDFAELVSTHVQATSLDDVNAAGRAYRQMHAKTLGRALAQVEDTLFPPAGEAPVLRMAKPSDLFTLMYTSGSCGAPKGVVRSFSQWHYLLCFFTQGVGRQSKERVLCYAPLCHIMERSSVWSTYCAGEQIGLFNRHSSELLDDVRVLQPEVLSAPPTLWNTLLLSFKLKPLPYVSKCKLVLVLRELVLIVLQVMKRPPVLRSVVCWATGCKRQSQVALRPLQR
jgi:long-subunit acyl-CoA synthetase (AMP-forming)